MSKVVTIEATAGDRFDEVAKRAQKLAGKVDNGCIVCFEFNGIKVNVDNATNLANLYRDYSNSFVLNRKSIGPVCHDVLSEDEQHELDEANRKAEERRRVQQEAYERENRRKTDALESQISDVTFSLKPGVEQEYATYLENNSKDGYSKGVVDYTDRWARLMQVKLQAGAKIEDIAEETSHQADIDGITGFMYGCAVSALSHFWIHGDVIKKWHNGQYGQPDAKGVVNPAVLTISVSEDA